LHLASRFAGNPEQDQVFDYLPEGLMPRVINGSDFARSLVADKWTCNCDGRQVVFARKPRDRNFHATFIDQGYCFNAGEWTFPDLPLHGVYYRNYVYREVIGWESFEPALSRAETMGWSELWEYAEGIPAEWYENDSAGLSSLVETLYQRRSNYSPAH
jgi:hypothetical protein